VTSRPDLFIIGAPKCGTTSLFQYLVGHPEVFLSPVKEPQFFAGDPIVQRGMAYPQEMDRYLALFAAAGDAKRVGEASTSYLESPEAAGRIREFNPEARMVAMLRDPVEMMYSMHGMRVAQGVEPITDFAAALEAERTRLGYGTVGDGSSVRYRDRARYAEMLPRWFETFGRDRVHVIITEELAAEPEPTFVRLLEFLEVDPAYRPDTFRRYNTSLKPRSLLLSRLIGRLPHRTVPVSPLDRLTIPLARLLRRSNRRRVGRPPLDPELRARLEASFRPDVTRLEDLLGQELLGRWWWDGAPASAAVT
jgi:hypothetical protein